jgi:hypothetical protein
MTRNEAVQKLATAGRLSIAHAEDLYDSFFPKPVVPKYVADWYEKNRIGFGINVIEFINGIQLDIDDEELNELEEWLLVRNGDSIQTLVDMHRVGYEVEKEAKYTVRFKWLYGGDAYLTDKHFANWCDIRNDREEIKDNLQHTRKELEDAGFEWVFDCPGIEVKEVDDGND